MTFKLLPVIIVLSLTALSAFAVEPELERAPKPLTEKERRNFKGPYEMIVCLESEVLNVRNADLRRILFQAKNYTPVKIFQGWGENKKSRVLRGERVHFIKVQITRPNGRELDGWVAKDFVRPRSRCEGAPQYDDVAPVEAPVETPVEVIAKKPTPANKPTAKPTEKPAAKPVEEKKPTGQKKPGSQPPADEDEELELPPIIDGPGFSPAPPTTPLKPTPAPAETESEKPAAEKKPERPINGATSVSGLNDERCCNFPLSKEPASDYTSGAKKFGAQRITRNKKGKVVGKRLHAASDLYSNRNDPILAVAYGKVARAPYYFYQGTYAIEVTHIGGFVVRYGEINGKQAPGIHPGRYVQAGQPVGFMGKTDCCTPMLHFELYSGAKKGSLSSGGNQYQRRGDLMDPTPHLKKWQENQFKIRK